MKHDLCMQRWTESQLTGADGLFQPSGLNRNVLVDCLGTQQKVHDPFGCAASKVLLGDVLGRWGVSRQGFDSIAACMVPKPIADLLLKGRWQDLVFMLRWAWFRSPLSQQGMWESFRVPQMLADKVGQHETLSVEALDLAHVETFLNTLRRWSPIILASCRSDEEYTGEQMLLESFATWLRQLLFYFKPHFETEAACLESGGKGHQRYSDSHLVGMVLFAWHLRDSVSMKEAMPSALQAIMPDLFANSATASGKHVFKQSKSLLRNAQLAVDIALMLVRRQGAQNAGQCARYGWADSSAVAKSDWLISKHQVVPSSRCVHLWQSWAELVSLIPADSEGEHEQQLDPHAISSRRALSQELLAEVRVQTQPPQALGLGLTSVENKLAALLYSFYLEVGSMKGLKELLSTFVSFTTDMGTEMDTASFMLDDLRKLLPDWLAEPLLQGDVDDGGEQDDAGDFGALVRFMPNALIIPGALHICSNLCKDVSGKLTQWDTFLKQLSSFEALLCNRDRRERFLSTCMPAAASAERDLFKNFSGSLYEKRWNEGADEGPAARFVAADLTFALSSHMFHVYMQMVMSLFNIVGDLSSWFEGCACHNNLLKKRRNIRSAKKELEQSGSTCFCSMKGKRAPELAAGCLKTVFQQLVSLKQTSLLQLMHEKQLSQEDEMLVMQDFEAGRGYVQLGLAVKFNFWGKLPWRLAALSHADPDVARAAAADMLQTTVGLDVPNPSLVHHPVTLKFLGPDSSLRPMLQSFADGEGMSRELQLEAYKLAFMPVVERSIEAKHSLISRRVQKNWRSGRIVSLTLRVPEIKAEFAADRSFQQKLVDAFALVRDPMNAARQLGIQEHPDLVHALFSGFHHARVTGIVNRIVYRCDLESKYASYTEARKKHEQESSKRARLADKQMAQLVAPEQSAGSQQVRRRTAHEHYDLMLRQAVQDHFTHLVSSSPEPLMYSLDLAPSTSGNAPSLTPLDAAFEGEKVFGIQRASAVPVLSSDVAEFDEKEQQFRFQGAEVVHFQVVHASPRHMHTVPMPRAAGKRLGKGQIAVTVHSLIDQGDGARRVQLDPVSQGETCVAILAHVAEGDLDTLRETFTQFSLGQMSYNIKGFLPQQCPSCVEAVSQLVRAGAFPDSAAHVRVAMVDGRVPVEWLELEAAGFVTRVPAGEGETKTFRLTSRAVVSLQAVAELKHPKLVCEPRSDIPRADCSVYELVQKLERDGWSWSRLPTSVQKRKELGYASDSAKNFYSLGGPPHPLYLQCLLQADALRELGVELIPHWSPSPAATYKNLLKGETAPAPGQRRLALLDDVDDGGENQAPLSLLDEQQIDLMPVDCDGEAEASSDLVDGDGADIAELLALFSSDEDAQADIARSPSQECLPAPRDAELGLVAAVGDSEASTRRGRTAVVLERGKVMPGSDYKAPPPNNSGSE